MSNYDTAVRAGYQRNYSMKDNAELEGSNAPKYPLWMECYKVFLMFSFPVFLLMFVAYYQGGKSFLFFPAVFMLFPILSTLVRRLIKNLVLYVLAHGVMGLWFLLSPSVLMTFLGVIYLILIFVYGMVRRLSKQQENDLSYGLMFAAFGIMMITHLLIEYFGRTGFTPYLMWMSIIYLALYLFYEHRTSVLDAIRVIDRKSNFSVNQILRFNSGMFVVYMLIMGGSFAALYFMGLGDLVALLGRYFIMLIKRLLRLLLRAEPTEETMIQEEEIQRDMMDANPMAGLDQGKTSVFWVFMQRVLVVVFIIAVVAGLIFLLYFLYKRFNASYAYSGAGYEEEKSFFSKDEVEEKKGPRFSIFDRSFESRVRRTYYRKVKKAMGKTVFVSDTPLEVAGKLPEVQEILPDYEEVRYDPLKHDHN